MGTLVRTAAQIMLINGAMCHTLKTTSTRGENDWHQNNQPNVETLTTGLKSFQTLPRDFFWSYKLTRSRSHDNGMSLTNYSSINHCKSVYYSIKTALNMPSAEITLLPTQPNFLLWIMRSWVSSCLLQGSASWFALSICLLDLFSYSFIRI